MFLVCRIKEWKKLVEIYHTILINKIKVIILFIMAIMRILNKFNKK